MIDRGISEEYVVWWLEQEDACTRDRIDQFMRRAALIVRHGAGGRSLFDLYDDILRRFTGSHVLAAEFVRHALQELAYPTPIDDGLPPPDSAIWEIVYGPLLHSRWSAALKQTNAHPQSGPH